MALTDKPQPTYPTHGTPTGAQISGKEITSVEHCSMAAKTRQRQECGDRRDSYCMPISNWDQQQRDWKYTGKMDRRLNRGGANFSPGDGIETDY